MLREGNTVGPILQMGLVLFVAAGVGCGARALPKSVPTDAASFASYRQGAYLCCAKGEGLSCCGGATTGTCFGYGGTLGDCTPEGNTLDGKDICSICCPGLTRVSLSMPSEAGAGDAAACVGEGPPSLLLCVACGDGVCGPSENSCNCPTDCH